MTSQIKLVLRGDLPSKKNLWRHGPRGVYLPRAAAATIENLTLQARAAWGSRPPVESPDIEWMLFLSNRRRDRDNIVTMLTDVLVKARVLVNDNVARCNGVETKHPVVIVDKQDERAEITLKYVAGRHG